MTPNKIIAALLDITSAAYNVAHNGRKDTIDGRPMVEVDPSQHDTLMNALAVLDPLMAEVVATQANPPACARELLESFLVGEHIVGEIAMTRTRPFGVEGVDHVTVNIGTADVQRDGIQFHAQPWQAPATGPGFVPSAEFPTSGPISHDFYTHRDTWRHLMSTALTFDPDDKLLLEHELRAFDRAFASLPPTTERRAKPRLDLPTIPVVGKDALIEATRPLFEKAMKSHGYIVEINALDMYEGFTEYRWEGWSDAVKTMGFKPGSDDIGALREQAEAWQAVSAALHTHTPDWSKLSTRAMDSAVMSIEKMANSPRKPYTHQIGEAGDKYMETFKFAHPLPVTFRWHELWHALNDAASTPVDNTAMLHNMIAETSNEALKLINDAGLLANLHDLFKMEPCAEVSIRELKTGGWTIYVDPFDQDTKPRSYRSTSMHQAIVVSHKGEYDLKYPEPDAPAVPTTPTVDKPALLTQVGWRHVMHQEHGQERVVLDESKACPWGERGVNFSPEYAVTVAPVYEKAGERPEPEGDASTEVPAHPTAIQIRRNHMQKLLVDVKDRFDAPTAKALFGNYTPFAKMSLIPDGDIETVIAAAEAKLKEPK